MKKLTFILLTFFSICIQAQPVLNASDFVNGISSEFISANSNGIAPGSSGENQIWDFSNVVLGINIYNFSSIPISQAPSLKNFPNANFCYYIIGGGDIIYDYYDLSSEGFECVGQFEDGNIDDIYSNPRKEFEFPFEYNVSFTDVFQVNFQQQGTINVTYDAYGTLITPFATFENVIRKKNEYDSATIYYWYKTNPLTLLATFNTDSGLFITNSINLKTNQNTKSSFSIYPNPTNGNLSIRNSNSIDKEVVVMVYDVLGNTIIENKELNSVIENIDLSNFSSGLYFVKIMNKNNQLLYIDKIVKQ